MQYCQCRKVRCGLVNYSFRWKTHVNIKKNLKWLWPGASFQQTSWLLIFWTGTFSRGRLTTAQPFAVDGVWHISLMSHHWRYRTTSPP
jgi:hypothetical protein